MNFFRPLAVFISMVVIVLKNLLKMSLGKYSPNDKDSMIYAADNMILLVK